MPVRITHPTASPKGTIHFGGIYTLRFIKGAATVDDLPLVLAAILKQGGYRVTPVEPEDEVPTGDTEGAPDA